MTNIDQTNYNSGGWTDISGQHDVAMQSYNRDLVKLFLRHVKKKEKKRERVNSATVVFFFNEKRTTNLDSIFTYNRTSRGLVQGAWFGAVLSLTCWALSTLTYFCARGDS